MIDDDDVTDFWNMSFDLNKRKINNKYEIDEFYIYYHDGVYHILFRQVQI